MSAKERIKRMALCLICMGSVHSLSAMLPTDSLHAEGKGLPSLRSIRAGDWPDRLAESRLYGMTYVGVPLVVGGFLVKGEDDHFRSLRNNYMPYFNRHVDDYMQFAPAVVMLGLKAGGLKGRSSWGRMLVSDAFAAILMGGVVNTMKHNLHVQRPDGSNSHSFPSGHTATAFMTATMLNKEYGERSPWIGIGAYTVASATGLMRMANNKHWLSDVLTGAGIGVLSTELGYYLADLIFKEHGLQLLGDKMRFDRMERPTFVSLYMGVNIPLSGYDIDDDTPFSTSSGSTAGLEGAYFFSPYWGVGGRFTASGTTVIVEGDQAVDDTWDALSLASGAYFSYPVGTRWLIGGKLLGEYIHYPSLALGKREIPSRSGAGVGSGVSVTFKAKPHYGISFFLDYDLRPSHSRGSREHMNILTAGASFMIVP